MCFKRYRLRYLVAATAIIAVQTPALAADEEVEVYTGYQAAKGELDLSLHMNYVTAGEPGSEFSGGETTTHRLRITPEFSYGLGGGFEIATYLPLITIAPDNVVRAQGVIGRIQWIRPKKDPYGFFWGGNLELGRLSSQIDENPWHGEVKAIAGWKNRRWTVAVNPTVGFVIDGPVAAPATFALNSKIAFNVTPKLAVGIESYNGTGAISDAVHFRTSEQSSYAVVDAPVGKWFVHAGVGIGYGGNRDHAIAVLSLGIPLPHLRH
jgi:hypothetical protein